MVMTFIWTISILGKLRARLHDILKCLRGIKSEKFTQSCVCRAYPVCEANEWGSDPITRTSPPALQSWDGLSECPGQVLSCHLFFLVCCGKVLVSFACKGLRPCWSYVVLACFHVRLSIRVCFQLVCTVAANFHGCCERRELIYTYM